MGVLFVVGLLTLVLIRQRRRNRQETVNTAENSSHGYFSKHVPPIVVAEIDGKTTEGSELDSLAKPSELNGASHVMTKSSP